MLLLEIYSRSVIIFFVRIIYYFWLFILALKLLFYFCENNMSRRIARHPLAPIRVKTSGDMPALAHGDALVVDPFPDRVGISGVVALLSG